MPFSRSSFEQPGQPSPAHGLHTFRLTVAYDGTDFFGWQVQPNLRTIQGHLSDTIREVTGEAVLPQGSGRTDTGVHAEGQVVSLQLRAAIPADRLQRALNRRLPAAIRITELREVDDSFHARTNVVNKTYEYRIFERRVIGEPTERICAPTLGRFVWDCRWPLDFHRMQQAAQAVAGTHDFTSFAASDPDRATRLAEDPTIDNVRTIFSSEWLRAAGLLVYRVTGSGFLHHMVRNIVGTCVEVGAGRIEPESMRDILSARDRRHAGMTAPPQGLHMMQVVYKGDPEARA